MRAASEPSASFTAARFPQTIGALADVLGCRGPETAGMDDRPILIYYDGSKKTRTAIASAAVLFPGRRALVLDIEPLAMVAETYAAVGSGAAGLEHDAADHALERATLGAGLASAAGLRAEARGIVDSPPWHGIVEVADEIGAAAIVLGSNGRGGPHEPLGRRLPDQVAVRAGRPVLVVPGTEGQG